MGFVAAFDLPKGRLVFALRGIENGCRDLPDACAKRLRSFDGDDVDRKNAPAVQRDQGSGKRSPVDMAAMSDKELERADVVDEFELNDSSFGVRVDPVETRLAGLPRQFPAHDAVCNALGQEQAGDSVTKDGGVDLRNRASIIFTQERRDDWGGPRLREESREWTW